MREKVRSLLTNDFEKHLYEACLANLDDVNNVLRYNNFAFSIRELSRHFLKTLAPDENVKRCSWFKEETPNGNLSRGQRIIYAVQRGLTDKILEDMGYDLDELNIFKREMLETVDSLSKYTHIEPETFGMDAVEVERRSNKVLSVFATMVKMMDGCRKKLYDFLDTRISNHVLSDAITQSFDNIDCLAPHYSLEDIYVEDYKITDIDYEHISVDVTGKIDVVLEYGSRYERGNDDGMDVNKSFPFETTVTYTIGSDFPNDDYEVEPFDGDTSEWWQVSEQDEETMIWQMKRESLEENPGSDFPSRIAQQVDNSTYCTFSLWDDVTIRQ